MFGCPPKFRKVQPIGDAVAAVSGGMREAKHRAAAKTKRKRQAARPQRPNR